MFPPGRGDGAIAGEPRQSALEERSSDLLTATHVAGGRGDHDTALDEPGQRRRSARVVAAVRHRDDDDVGGGMVEAERMARAGPRP